jgi:hypothetical protein
MRFLLLALCLPLAGCFSVAGPKPVPEWAMVSHAGDLVQRDSKPTRTVTLKRERSVEAEVATASVRSASDSPPTMTQSAGLGHAVVRRKPTALAPARDVTAFSAEWHAREDLRDVDLKRSMGNVCRGC